MKDQNMIKDIILLRINVLEKVVQSSVYIEILLVY